MSLGMYAFYNHLIEKDIDLINHYNSATIFDKQNLGITLASAYTIKRLKSKKFTDYHFNDGRRVNPKVYNLRYFSHLFYFHTPSRSHLAVPFHELSYFTIQLAQEINKQYRRLKAEGKMNFFFFFFPGLDNLLPDDNDIIPILDTNIEELVADFRNRSSLENNDNIIYRPQALVVLETEEN